MGILISIEFGGESRGKFDSRTLSRETLSRWTRRSAGSDGEADSDGEAASCHQCTWGQVQDAVAYYTTLYQIIL